MKDEELLAGLADAARKQASLDDRFGTDLDELAASAPCGEQTEEQIQELLKQYSDLSNGRTAVSLFAPLSGEARERIVDRIGIELGDSKAQVRPKPGKVIRWASWLPVSKRTLYWVAGTAAAAVMVFVFLRPKEGMLDLPDYQMSLYGQVKTVRGLEPEPLKPETVPVFRTGSILQIVLRPDRAVMGKARLSAFFEENGGLTPVELPVEWDAQGSVRVYGVVGKDIRLPLGEVRLWLVVSRPGQDLMGTQIKAMQAAGSRLVMTARIRIEPNGVP